MADRDEAATARYENELARDTAQADRGVAAQEYQRAALDGLTGALLRDRGVIELGREVARARLGKYPLFVAFIDVDQLKAINDSRGHAAGDRILLSVVSALRASLRPSDLIIRYGGDEFVCAIPEVDLDVATERLARTQATLAEGPEPCSISVGLTGLRPGDSTNELVARADAELYQERERRRHRHS